MPAYAAWLEQVLSAAAARSPARFRQGRPLSIDPHRVIVVADYLPSANELREYLDGVPALIAAPMMPAEPIPDVAYTTFRTSTNPIEWGPEVDSALAQGADTVAFLRPADEVHGRTLFHLWRLGVKRCLLLADGKFHAVQPLLEAARKKIGSMLRNLAPGVRSAQEKRSMTVADCRRFLEASFG